MLKGRIVANSNSELFVMLSRRRILTFSIDRKVVEKWANKTYAKAIAEVTEAGEGAGNDGSNQ